MLLMAANLFGSSWHIESVIPNIVSYFGHLFLRTIEPKMWADFVESSLEDEFIYITMAEDFKPVHLLDLAKISVLDLEWGGYQDLFVNEEGEVVAWYHGSATGFGSFKHYRPPGIIGRIVSYFPPGNPEPKFEHERYLRRRKANGLTPNFRKVFSVKPEYTGLHKCWTLGLEAQVMTITSMNVDLPGDGRYRTDTIGEWTANFREAMGLPSFPDVYAMNKCLPLRQGIPFDRRFKKDLVKKCANPVANCPQTNGPWKLLHRHLPMSIERLCGACHSYRRYSPVHRPQRVIDEYQHRLATEEDGCWWCFRDFPPKSVHDRRRPIRDLDDAYVCKDCYSFWKEGPTLLPIPGVHFHPMIPFSCEGYRCRLQDRTMAPEWRFLNGRLLCVQCWSNMENTPASRKTAANAIKNSAGPHTLDHTDCKMGLRRAGWAEYIRTNFDVQVIGATTEQTVASIRALKDLISHVDVDVRDA